VKRTISLKFPNLDTQKFDIHVAHYSDMVFLKVLKNADNAYLIAEDKTGYTVWDLYKRTAVAEDGMENNEVPDEISGTAEDYMTHISLTEEQWTKVLGLKSSSEVRVTEVKWLQLNN
jgi:4-aminobutyrate aminotransferase-like enzyme